MAYVQGLPRHQIRMMSLDDMVAPDSIARVVDRFIEGLDLKALGFKAGSGVRMGRSSYDPRIMTKMLVFGCLEDIRSSRRMERACSVNTEMMWLADGLAPDHKTIANFRKDNPAAIQALFDEFGSFTEYAGLVGKSVLAIDGTKIRASNSKKRMLTKKKLEKQKEHHEARAKEYLDALAEADGDEAAEACRERAADHAGKAAEAEAQMAELEAAGISELGLTDKDAHNMGDKSTGVRPAYNVQAAVDSEAHIVVAHDIHTRADDHGCAAAMLDAAATAIRSRGATGVLDKGYWGHDDISACKELGLDAVICPQGGAHDSDGARVAASQFAYDSATDSYTCPEGHTLDAHSRPDTKVRRFYNKAACAACPAAGECLGDKQGHRVIRRQEYSEVLEEARARYQDGQEAYALRQQTVEHVFGTIKRAMGADHFLLRGADKVRTEASLLFLAYNVRRASNALGFEQTMARLDGYFSMLAEHAVEACDALFARILACVPPRRRRLRPAWAGCAGQCAQMASQAA